MIVNYVLGVLLIVVVLFLWRYLYVKNRIKKLKTKLILEWGKPKKDEFYNFSIIDRYFENNNSKSEAFHIISDEIQYDLDIHELFKFVNRTSSKIGQQYLYAKLRTIGSFEDLKKFDELSEFFRNNEAERIDCQIYLSNLNHSDSYDLEDLIHGAPIKKPKILWLVYLLSITNIVLIILGFFNSFFLLFILPILAVNFFFHFQNKKNIEYYASGVNQLSRALKVGKRLMKVNGIKSHYKEFPFIGAINAIKFKTVFFGIEKNLANEYAFVLAYFVDVLKMLFNIEYIIFYSFIDSIISRKKSIEAMYCFIGEVDSSIAAASVKSGNLYVCTPQFTAKKNIIIEELIHPLVDECVGNDIELLGKSMLLTGSNMSGKSTFVRALAINSLLAQTLNICFAKSYQAPFLKLYSSIRMSDDVTDERSYYLTEVLRIKELLQASEQEVPCLFILDEIFKGTNTVERIAGAKGILSYLNRKNGLVLVSTHDIELTELLVDYEQFHFSETVLEGELYFDHKIKSGKLKSRNAIRILELYDYPAEIVKEAREIEKNYFS